MLMQQRV